MLKLYDYFRSSAAFRVRIALNLKNLPYESVPIHLVQDGGQQHSESYQKINPHQLVPALEDSQGVITQSLAIIEYINDLHPLPALLPIDPYQKALVRSFALAIACDVHPLNNLRVLNYLNKELAVSEENKNKWYQHWINKGLAGLEKQINQNHETTFCFGEEPSLADICLIPQLYNAKRFNCDLSNYPNLVRIDKNCQQLPAFIQALPESLATIGA